MAVNTIEVREKIIKTITPADGIAVVPLFTHTPFSKLGYRVLDESLAIKNLEARTFVYSLPTVQFPSFELTASDSEIQLQTLLLEWESPRYHLNLLMSNDLLNWTRTSVVSILNSAPMPYREFLLGDIDLGNNSMIGFQVNSVGHGILSGSDEIVVTANLIRNVILEKIKEGKPFTYTLTANTVRMILTSNTEREGFTVFNESNSEVYLDITDSVSATNFLVKISPDGYYESPSFLVNSEVYAVTEGIAELYIREFI